MEKKRLNRILVVLFFGVLMGALDIAIVGPALPVIQTSLRLSERSLSWIFSIYVLFNLVGTPIMTRLSDTTGRRAIYLIDLTLFAAGSLVVAAAPSFALILVGRAIQGFGAGGIFPVASAVIGDHFPQERRGSALGLIGAVFGLAFLVGPALAGLILTITSWHWLFLINVPIAAIIFTAAAFVLPKHQRSEKPRFDWLGMSVLSLMLGMLTVGLSQIDASNLALSVRNPFVLPFLGAAIVLLVVLILTERFAANPILPRGLFASRQLRIGYALTAGAGVGEAAVVFIPVFAVASIQGLAENQASFLVLPAVLAMAVGSPLAGRMLDRYGSRSVMLIGLIILTVGVFLLSRFSSTLWLFIVSEVLIGFGLSTVLGAPIRYITLNEVPSAIRSTAQGAVTVFTGIGQLIGSAAVGAIAASLGGGKAGYADAFRLLAVLAAIMALGTLALKSRAAEQESARVGT